jgi:hypothetical protein
VTLVTNVVVGTARASAHVNNAMMQPQAQTTLLEIIDA